MEEEKQGPQKMQEDPVPQLSLTETIRQKQRSSVNFLRPATKLTKAD